MQRDINNKYLKVVIPILSVFFLQLLKVATNEKSTLLLDCWSLLLKFSNAILVHII